MSGYKSRIINDPYYSPYRGTAYNPYSYGSRYYPQSYQTYAQAPRQQGYSEYIPIEKSVVDYEPEYHVQYRPVERPYTDYREVRHEVDYVPVPRVEYDYIPQERSYVVGETNNEPLVRSRIANDRVYNDRYIDERVIAPRVRPYSSIGARQSGYYGSYYSPYKYL